MLEVGWRFRACQSKLEGRNLQQTPSKAQLVTVTGAVLCHGQAGRTLRGQGLGTCCDILGQLVNAQCSQAHELPPGCTLRQPAGRLTRGQESNLFHMLDRCTLSRIAVEGSRCLQLSEEQRAALQLEIGICGVTREDEEEFLEVSFHVVLVDCDVPLGSEGGIKPGLTTLHEKSLLQLGHN